MTGRYPLRAGLATNAGSPPIDGNLDDGAHGLPGEQVTLAETFKSAGYATAQIGKWHLGFAKGMTGFGKGRQSGCQSGFHRPMLQEQVTLEKLAGFIRRQHRQHNRSCQ